MKIKELFVWAVFVFSLFSASVSQATTLRRQSIAQLAARADCVVRGHVVARKSERRDDVIYTLNSFVVDEVLQSRSVLKNSLVVGKTLNVAQLGGQLGDWQMQVAGTAALQTGDSQVLFLLADPQREDAFYIAGMSQGALKLLGQDKLLWAATAPLWANGQIKQQRPRWLSLAELRILLGGRP